MNRFIFGRRNKANQKEHVKLVHEAIALVKRAIDLEKKGATVAAKKDKKRLQGMCVDGKIVPRKNHERFIEEEVAKGKQRRIEGFKRRLKELESARDVLRDNNANYEIVNLRTQAAILEAAQQIDGDVNTSLGTL